MRRTRQAHKSKQQCIFDQVLSLLITKKLGQQCFQVFLTILPRCSLAPAVAYPGIWTATDSRLDVANTSAS
ncbi:MAG: hypothetical protein DMG57_37445 [Acidobacteria bacterium]|nr:MAG: hypothetical protein DMG57_37445 [Acidobacteriota bacterium]